MKIILFNDMEGIGYRNVIKKELRNIDNVDIIDIGVKNVLEEYEGLRSKIFDFHTNYSMYDNESEDVFGIFIIDYSFRASNHLEYYEIPYGVCNDPTISQMSRKFNDSRLLVMDTKKVGIDDAFKIVKSFIST